MNEMTITDHTLAGGRAPSGRADRRQLDLGQLALLLALAGLLPIPGPAASLAAIVCGVTARRSEPARSSSAAAWAGVAIGALQVVGGLVVLFVYCVVLGYPFPIHRYQG